MIRNFKLAGCSCRALVLSVLAVAGASAHERDAQALTIHHRETEGFQGMLRTDWQSRYASEGRDNLAGDSLWGKSVELSWQSWSWGAWHGESPDQDYDELQLSAAWHKEFDAWEFYGGYTHLRFPHDGSHDHELGIGLIHKGCPWGIEHALDVYHSIEAGGYFAEATATRAWELGEKSSIELAAVFGVNQGYIADGHDGANHLALQAGWSYALTESLSVSSHAAYSWGIGRKAAAAGDDALEDFFHAGLGLEWIF